VILGCPHFSIDEFRKLARTLQTSLEKCHPDVQFYVMTNQVSYELARRNGLLEILQQFGARITVDTCVLNTPITLPGTRLVMTNSGKDAYYAPSELGVDVVFASLDACVQSAAAGVVKAGGEE
jgi:predicted aconitase